MNEKSEIYVLSLPESEFEKKPPREIAESFAEMIIELSSARSARSAKEKKEKK